MSNVSADICGQMASLGQTELMYTISKIDSWEEDAS